MIRRGTKADAGSAGLQPQSGQPGTDLLPPCAMRRELLQNLDRVVVKLGTGILTDSRKQLHPARVQQLVRQVAGLRNTGKEIVLVSSGAVGAGMGVLGYEKRPAELSGLQACAAVGQSRLMSMYEKQFEQFGLHVAQVLLTHDDLRHHERHLNARNTLLILLQKGIIPIINENDAVSFTELKFGDNDKLSALVACLLPADLLVILTTAEGLVERFDTPEAKVIPLIERIDGTIEKLAQGTQSATAVGGMITKVQAAKMTVRSGIPTVIASGLKLETLSRILDGEDEGTLFVPKPDKLKGRKRWIAFFHHPKGSLWVDEGARQALRESGKSLLPPGIVKCEGDFAAGEIVRICDVNGTEFARGISQHDADDIRSGTARREEVIHRNNLVVL
jgi:glutamate 5-kinase